MLSQGISSQKSKNCVKICRARGKKRKNQCYLRGEGFGHAGQAAVEKQQMELLCSQSVQQDVPGCAQGLLRLKRLLYLTILHGTGMQTGNKPQQLCDAYCSTQINQVFL